MQADNDKCGVGVAYNSKVGGKGNFYFERRFFIVLFFGCRESRHTPSTAQKYCGSDPEGPLIPLRYGILHERNRNNEKQCFRREEHDISRVRVALWLSVPRNHQLNYAPKIDYCDYKCHTPLITNGQRRLNTICSAFGQHLFLQYTHCV